jgi:hypothetical protein
VYGILGPQIDEDLSIDGLIGGLLTSAGRSSKQQMQMFVVVDLADKISKSVKKTLGVSRPACPKANKEDTKR